MEGASIPSPTEIATWKADRKERKRHRLEWIESLHLCPPGTNWRTVEQANRRALSLERFARCDRGERTNIWTELGSVNLAGRTHAAFPSSDGELLYVGSNLGGVWRATIDGDGWTALADGLGLGSYQLLVAPPGAGPGEPEVILTLASSTIHASIDEGSTWVVPEGLPETIYGAIRVVHDAAQPRTVYFLCKGRQWNGHAYEYGHIVSRSTDGGQSFTSRYIFPNSPADMWIDRTAGGSLYVMSSNTIYVSADEALTFDPVGSLPCGWPNDVLLTGSEAGAPAFYAALKQGSDWKLYRSIDGGVNWVWRYDINDFWETLVASITNPDLIFFAGVECYRSTDGGGTFNKINEWWEYYGDPENRLHADLPGMDIHIVGGQEAVYFNTDGGTYVSYDGGQTVQNLSLWGLAISQYYSTFTSQTDPYLIAGGSQDQGYQQSLLGGESSQQSSPDGRNGYLPFEQLISGDYGHLTSTIRDHNLLYSVYPGFVLLQINESAPQYLCQLDFPPCAHSWMPFILADPLDSEIFYFCGDHLWRYERSGWSYYTMTELPQDFGAGGGFLTALAISPVDYNYWYAVTNNGALWYSHNAGGTWTHASSGPHAHYFYGTSLVVSRADREVAYVGGSGYLNHPVWRTTDGGQSWEGMGDGLPNTLVLGLALGGESGEELFAACEAGPFGFDAGAGHWVSLIGTEAPLTTYWCVEWVPEAGVVRFGTYGRGIWDYALPDPSGVAEGEGAHPSSLARASRLVLDLSPNPAHDELAIRFRTTSPGKVDLQLFDVSGRRLASLADGMFAPGDHEVSCNLAKYRLEPGIYLARLSSPDGVSVRKLQVR